MDDPQITYENADDLATHALALATHTHLVINQFLRETSRIQELGRWHEELRQLAVDNQAFEGAALRARQWVITRPVDGT